MAFIRGEPIQTGADVFRTQLLALPILDGKTGYEFKALEIWWRNGEAVGAADFEVRCSIQTSTAQITLSDENWLIGDGWAAQNTAGAAVLIPLDIHRQFVPFESRITVQPEIYFTIFSANTAQANQVDFVAYYDTVKMTELEYLRLLASGA